MKLDGIIDTRLAINIIRLRSEQIYYQPAIKMADPTLGEFHCRGRTQPLRAQFEQQNDWPQTNSEALRFELHCGTAATRSHKPESAVAEHPLAVGFLTNLLEDLVREIPLHAIRKHSHDGLVKTNLLCDAGSGSKIQA